MNRNLKRCNENINVRKTIVKLIQRLNSAMSMIFLFLPNNVSKFITHTILPLESIVQEFISYS